MSLFTRFFLLLGLLSSVSLALVAGLLWRNSRDLEAQLRAENAAAGARVQTKGGQLLERNLSGTQLSSVGEKARRVETYFAQISDALQLQHDLTRQFLSDGGSLETAPPLFRGNDLTHQMLGNPARAAQFRGIAPYAIYHLAPGVSAQKTQKEREQLRRLGAFFAHTMATLPDCDSVYLGTRSGFILGYPGGKTFFKPQYDPRKRPWYRGAWARRGETVWEATLDRDGKTILLTGARTVSLAGEDEPRGVVAIDMRLPSVVEELFDVGQSSASNAVLVDGAGRIRVSASYRQSAGRSRPIFDTRGVFQTPPVSQSRFARAYEHLQSQPKIRRAVWWQGRENGVPMARAEAAFLIARVRLGREIAPQIGRGASEDWMYLVRLPMTPILQPVREIQGEIRGATQGISQAIEVRTRGSGLLILLVSGATLGLCLVAAFFAARALSEPLVQMAQVARGVGEGNLAQSAPETGGREVSEMGRAINAMIAGLKQRNLLQDSFGRYVAPSVVQEVLERGGVQLGGVKSEATIFFSDLQGFTALAERTDPETLVALLNEYFDAMTRVILDEGGTLDKYIGDAILAFWGHPIAHPDDALRACRAALRQQKCLAQLCEKWEKEGRPPLQMRIGIETGEVIVGDIGSELKLNYTVLGDTVNFASRLEGANKFYGTQILIGARTRELAGEAIEAREIDLMAVKGKTQPVRVYELLGLKGELSPAKQRVFSSYETALTAFRARDWSGACRALEALKDDQASEVLRAKIAVFEKNPPPENWDGGTVLNEK